MQEFANNGTTSQEAMQIGRVEAGPVLSTPWVHDSAGLAKFFHLSPDCPKSKGKGKGKDNFGKDNFRKDNFGKGKGAYEWSKSTYDGNKGNIISHEIDPKVKNMRVLEAWETWVEPPLVEHARVLSSVREAPPKYASPQRVLRKLRKKKFMTWADMKCNGKGGHQQVEGEVLASPCKRTGWRMGGEGQQEEKEVREAEDARTGRTDTSTGFGDYTSAAILLEHVQDDRPREGSQRRRRLERG